MLDTYYVDCYSVWRNSSAMFCVVIVLAVVAEVPMTTTANAIQMKFDFHKINTTTSARAQHEFNACTEPGDVCDATCRRTGTCFQIHDAYVFRETRDCSPNFCAQSEWEAYCSTATKCVPNSGEIYCDTTGVFPDPYNCHNVLYCVAGRVASSVTACSKDTSYDSCTGFCDVALPHRRCLPQGPLCKFIGDFGTLPYNDRIYFYCVEDEKGLLHPVFGRCPKGFFDPRSFSCSESRVPGCLANKH